MDEPSRRPDMPQRPDLIIGGLAALVVTVDGRTLATVTDGPGSPGWTTGERVYTSGGIGLYTEDALAEFDAVTVTRR